MGLCFFKVDMIFFILKYNECITLYWFQIYMIQYVNILRNNLRNTHPVNIHHHISLHEISFLVIRTFGSALVPAFKYATTQY